MNLAHATVRTSYRISQILKKGSLHRGSFFDVKRLENDVANPRFVVVVSKRASKKAVERNRIKRRLKESLRLSIKDKTNPKTHYDYVIIGKSTVLDADYKKIEAAIGEIAW